MASPIAVAKITGDPEAIVDAYVQQGKYPGEVFADTYEANGRPVIQKWWDSAGGPTFSGVGRRLRRLAPAPSTRLFAAPDRRGL